MAALYHSLAGMENAAIAEGRRPGGDLPLNRRLNG
jgi:hypothetical protein